MRPLIPIVLLSFIAVAWGPLASADPVAVGVHEDAHGDVAAVSVFGDATACESTPCVAASGTGRSHALYALSGTGDASSCWDGLNCVAASGTGSASGVRAVSGGGPARSCEDTPECNAVSATGDAHGWIAASGTGDASSCWGWYECITVSGTGRAQSATSADGESGLRASSVHGSQPLPGDYIVAECHANGAFRIKGNEGCIAEGFHPALGQEHFSLFVSACPARGEGVTCSTFTGSVLVMIEATLESTGHVDRDAWYCKFDAGARLFGCALKEGNGRVYTNADVRLIVEVDRDLVNAATPSDWHVWFGIPGSEF